MCACVCVLALTRVRQASCNSHTICVVTESGKSVRSMRRDVAEGRMYGQSGIITRALLPMEWRPVESRTYHANVRVAVGDCAPMTTECRTMHG